MPRNLIKTLCLCSALVPAVSFSQDFLDDDVLTRDQFLSKGAPVLHLNDVTISAGPSTLGYTVSADYRLNKQFGIRGVVGYGEIDTEIVKEGIQVEGSFWGLNFTTDFPALSDKVDSEATIGGAMLLVDYYPGGLLGEEFRLSAGAFKSFYGIDGYGVVNEPILPHSRNPIFVQDLDIEMSIAGVSPYLGMGYSYHLKDNLYLSLDTGVMFNVKFDGSFSGTALSPSTQAEVDYELNKEMEDKLKELEPYTMIGYAGLTLSYRF